MKMIEKEYIELINKDIDKIISASEKEKLKNYLLKNPEAKTYYEDLLILNEYLSKIPEPEPPDGLSKRILNSIDLKKYKPVSNKFNTAFHSFANSRTWPKLGYVFVGIFVGFFIYAQFIDEAAFNKNDVRGTIGIENKRIQNVKEVQVNNKNITGTIQVMSSGDSFWFDVDLNSLKPFELALKYQNEVDLIDFSPNTLNFSREGDYIKFNNASGLQHFYIFFTKNLHTASLKLRIEQSGSVLFEQDFTVN